MAGRSGDWQPRNTLSPERSDGWIEALIERHRRKAKRTYRLGLSLRTIMVLFALMAVLPDSSLIKFTDYAAFYGAAVTIAGLLGALMIVVIRSLKITETLDHLHQAIDYLQERETALLGSDKLTMRLAQMEIRKELEAREASHRRGVLDGLDNVVDSWRDPGGVSE
ncbi:hypothetical protein [Glycomyces harbinensis]|uniref:Uncharacterized protein n=1 Tax=Glycomyces harbinensis TaxID=58114 RepID=A0A1G7B3G5_9ACTN|nr:hypothetical protein [Glycomyces harbinensis]SDE20816.1 hypothetical protein SAMN05216270_11577 [Glycomyces harbinensis]